MIDLNEIRELLLFEANKVERQAKNLTFDQNAQPYRIEERKGYARGLRDAYYLIEQHEANKKGDT